MSFAQRAIAADERKRHVAAVIGARTDVLKGCLFGLCTELTWRDGSEEHLVDAYKYSAWLFSRRDPLTQDFETQRELTDMIKNLSDEFTDECWCERLLAKD